MLKRLIDCTANEMRQMNKQELLKSIVLSEGCVVACETVGAVQSVLGSVTNAEFAAGMGADMLILNRFDVNEPEIWGLPKVKKEETIREIKRLTGRIVGVSLEPADQSMFAGANEEAWSLANGTKATLHNARRACAMGADMIVLTGNPESDVQNKAISESLRTIFNEIGDKVVLAAGKIHASGPLKETGQGPISKPDIRRFKEAGADVILMPAPGTIPGMTVEYIREMVLYAHSLGMLTITAVGTSQEGADRDTIRRIALLSKMTGTDMHHLGDGAYAGMALPENIMAYSIAVKGIRQTYLRMAQSVNR